MERNIILQEKIDEIDEAVEEIICIVRNTKVAAEAMEEEACIAGSMGAVEKLLKSIRINELGSLRDMVSP